MAKEFTLKGIISFIDQGATQTIKKVDESVVKMGKHTQKIGAGMRQVNQGLLVVGAGGAIAAAGFAKAIKTSAVFEQQMARVGALSRATDQEMTLLTTTAKRLGATTEFTATQAGQGLEFLSLAGFKAQDSISVLPTILDTAAAGAMDLGRASDIVTDSMSALGTAFQSKFNTPVKKATRLADIMALTQAKSNTNIEQLGEAIKFGGGALSGFGVPLTQIIAGMGKLADAGLKGSLGGTALTNMFNKLVKPSGKVKGIMKLLGVNMEKLPLQDMPKLVGVLSGALNKLKDPNQKAMIATQLFGARGIRAYNALANAGEKSLRKLTGELDASAGSAKQIADRQRATFMGQVKSFQSAVEGIMIEIGDFFTKSEDQVLPAFRNVVKFLQNLGAAFQFVNMGAKEQKKAFAGMSEGAKGLISFAEGFKEGISEAFTTIKEAFTGIRGFLDSILPPGKEGTKMFGKMIAKFSLLAAALAPVLIGFVGLSFAIGSISSGILGLGKVVSGSFGLLKMFGSGLWKVVSLVKHAGLVFTKMGSVLAWFGPKLLMVGGILKGALITGFIAAKGAVISLGTAIAATPIGWIIGGIVALVAAGYLLWKHWDAVTGFIKSAWEGVTNTFMFFVDWIKSAGIGEIIVKSLLFPIRAALTPLAELMKFIAGSSIAKGILGEEKAGFLKKFAETVSLIPDEQDLKVTKPSGAMVEETPLMMIPPKSPTVEAEELNQQRLESTRLSQPPSASQPLMLQQDQAPIDLTIENIMTMDGEVVSRKMTKKAINNSERAGMNAKNPKNRQVLNNGQFAPGFTR